MIQAISYAEIILGKVPWDYQHLYHRLFDLKASKNTGCPINNGGYVFLKLFKEKKSAP